ncbi:hypothetical protein AVEN_196642-1 [Araneus ventricosus]|uniref:Small ribosomal subunit protein mS26 n=1 Tax=Araneus ventricosus TaxID=182803 RepID=A0A4Y2E5G7_ARAVE|nr:hypothetical protein AVEN_196642-1 [Araneus ventricosus]
MSLLWRSHFPSVLKLHEACRKVSCKSMQLRWKKIPIRKPRWLPMAPSKLFRIPEHPYVPPDEKQLIEDLLEEYYRKIESLRKVFKEELAQKSRDEGHTLENQKLEEAKFLSLLEENKKENERLRKIREETMERLFQEKQVELLQLEENRKLKEQETKLWVEEMVRKEKEKLAVWITYENLDDAIAKALSDPRNVCYSVDVNGNVKWEGKPPDELEEEIKRRVAESMEN